MRGYRGNRGPDAYGHGPGNRLGPSCEPYGPGPYGPGPEITAAEIADAAQGTAALMNALQGPASVSGDAGSVTQHPIPALIQANNYLAGIIAGQTRRKGLRTTRLVPDATCHLNWNWPRWRGGWY